MKNTDFGGGSIQHEINLEILEVLRERNCSFQQTYFTSLGLLQSRTISKTEVTYDKFIKSSRTQNYFA